MSKNSKRQQLFELFNEIGIISQLASTEFNRRLPEGLHVSHFGVINHLYRLGDGCTPLQIAAAFQVTKPTMTNTLTKLTARGFVDIRDNPEDGRSKLVYLTEQGRLFRQQAIATLYPLMDEMDRKLDVEEIVTNLPSLKALREYLDKYRSR